MRHPINQQPSSAEVSSLSAEEKLNESRLALLMNDASIDQIMALDTRCNIIAWNKACEDITGVNKAAAIGQPFFDVRTGAENFPEIVRAIAQALKGFKSFVAWENGAYQGYFEHHFIPLKSDETVIGILIIIHDVAHRIKAEKQLQELNFALGQKNKELRFRTEELANFNWIASHDLKEPLRKIYTFIEMVATKEGIRLTDAARTNLRRAQSAVQRMGLLTDDIVNFSQVATAAEPIARVDLKETMARCLEAMKRVIEDDDAQVSVAPLPIITGYPELLKLLLHHMLSNSLKFHEAGSRPMVSVTYAWQAGKDIAFEEAVKDAHYHCIAFSDNGIGFDMKFSEKIFGMFQKLHSSGRFKGTGMGLPICKKVADAHQGFIIPESVEGGGSTFYCYLKDLGGDY